MIKTKVAFCEETVFNEVFRLRCVQMGWRRGWKSRFSSRTSSRGFEKRLAADI